ncbi:MAG: hypothetical protein IKJ49_03270 [Bacteroidaceae bacterium]|nr:hypothetical protein [Bacteroidaceae bacterium]
MEYDKLKDKFFLGTSTREEEDELRRYLLSDSLSAGAQEEKELLLAMLQPGDYCCDEDMKEVAALIDRFAEEESAKALHGSTARRIVLRYVFPAIAVAAVLALLLTVVPYSGNSVKHGKESQIAVVAPVTEQKQNGSAVNKEEPVESVLPKGAGKESVAGNGLDINRAKSVDSYNKSSLLATSNEKKPAASPGSPVVLRSGALPPISESDKNESWVVITVSEPPAHRDEESLASVSQTGGVNEVHAEASGERENVYIGSNSSFRLRGVGNDTITDPKEAIDHLYALFAIFSDATDVVVKEQEMHLKQLTVSNQE